MKEQINTSENPLLNEKNNDTRIISLDPQFNDLLINPESYTNHISELLTKKGTIQFNKILDKLINQFEPLDFHALAFSEITELRNQLAEIEKFLVNPDESHKKENILDQNRKQCKEIKNQIDKFKLNTKHYLVLSIENVLKLAEENNWGLCKNHDFIYLYNGSYWNNIDNYVFQKFLGEAAEKMGITKFSSRFYLFKEQLFKQFLTSAYLPTPEARKDTVLINLTNGTFEVTPGGINLLPFNKSDFMTYQLAFDYNPEAKAPIFESYLERVLPDIQKQNVVAEFLGYLFIKHGSSILKEEKTLLLYGPGANGKSVLFEVINALLGSENVSSYSLQSLTNENSYFRAMLANKLVNYASEISGNLNTTFFKQLVSGEPIEARLPYGQPFNLTQYAKMMFNCNALPHDVEHTHAYFRRFIIIHFDVIIPEAEQDKQLHIKIIQNELSGVFNWILEGLKRLIKQKGFSDCEAARLAREQYEKQSDNVKLFIEDREYEPSPNDFQIIKVLYSDYRTFCIEDGFKPLNKGNFIRRLENFGIIIEKKNIGKIAFIAKKN